MRRRLIPLLLAAFVLFSLGLLISAQGPEDSKFQKSLEAYLDAYWKFYPTSGTLAGYTKYNDRLEDLNPNAVEKRNNELDIFNQELVTKINKANLSPENQADLEILVDALDLELFRHESLVPWEYNPLFYNEILANCVQGLLGKNTAPLEARVKSATDRLKQIPGFVKQAKEDLKTPAQIYTETAIAQFPGILNFYKNDISALVAGASAEAKSKLMAEAAKAVTALEDFQNFFRNELLARSTGNFRLGEQAHLRLMRLTTQGSIVPDDLVARANADFKNIRREMALVCIPFYKVMYPNVNLEQMNRPEEEIRTILIKGVFDKIKTEHLSRDEFLSGARSTAATLQAFIEAHNLMALPEGMPAIEVMPVEKRGLTLTRLLGPGPYESSGPYTLYLSPIPDDWPPEAVNSFLEEYHNYIFPFTVAGKVYPGPYVPLVMTRQNPSLVRKLYPNLPLLRGWPAYMEETLVTAGYGNYDLRLRLSQLEMQLKAAMDYLLELNIHQGSMTEEQAINYMTRSGFQSEPEAKRKWKQIILSPGESAYTYIGYQEILDIEKDYKKAKGDSFKQSEFLQKLLSYGAIPPRQLKTRIMQ
ncbi:MAG: DUF885 domain-containing protein [Candidatus Aminicenantales bacterium]